MLLFILLALLFTFTIIITTIDYYRFGNQVNSFQESIVTPQLLYKYDLAMLNKILGDGEEDEGK